MLKRYSGTDSSVVIPEGVTEISSGAFKDYTSLTEIRYAGTKAQWEKVEKFWDRDAYAAFSAKGGIKAQLEKMKKFWGQEWYEGSHAKAVICTDGKVKL